MCARGKGGTRKVCDSPFLPLLILLLTGFIHLHTVINQGNPVALSNVSFLQRFFFLIPPSSLFGVTQIHINKYSGRTHRHPSSTKSASSQNHQTWISLTRISSSSHPSPDPNSHRKPQDGDEAEVLLGWAGSTGAVLCLHWWEVWGHVLSCVWSVCPCAEAMFLENSLASPGTALPRLLVTLRHAVSGNGDKDGSFGALIPRALLQNGSTSGCAQLLSPAASSCFFPEPGNPLTFRGVRGVEPCCQLALCPRSCGKRQPGDRPCPVQDPGSAVLGWGHAGGRDGTWQGPCWADKNHRMCQQTLLCPLSQVVGLWRVRGQQGLWSCSAPCAMSLAGLSHFPQLVTSPLKGIMLMQIFGKGQEPLALLDAPTAPMGDRAGVLRSSWGHPI